MKPSESKQAPKYGFTSDSLQALVESQSHKCAVCECLLHELAPGDWVIDHCHDTGLPRGVLCRRCNIALGYLGDSLGGVVEWSARALAYLTIGPIVSTDISSLFKNNDARLSIHGSQLLSKVREHRETAKNLFLTWLLEVPR